MEAVLILKHGKKSYGAKNNEAACPVVPMRSSRLSPGQGVNESESSVNFKILIPDEGEINES